MELTKFKELGLSENILKALKKKGFEEPTPIQEQTIPLLLKGEIDIVGQAQTGTGKTAAFGLPLIDKLEEKSKSVQALILAPTRELAIQVAEEINSLKGNKKLTIVPIYGGQSIEGQISKLRRGVDIVVGTPGRVIDHINRRTLKLENIKYFILDEADEMLNMGFIDDVKLIFEKAPEDKKVLLFSATMPREILYIAKKYMNKYKVISVKKQDLTTSLTEQIYFELNERDKFDALCRIIDVEREFYGVIFCRTKLDVDRVASKLTDRGYYAEGLHGDVSQAQRERTLNKFKKKKTMILVATDVAARGLDVNDLSHVINYALPQNPESYIHRIGRTGRAGKEGTAITFVTHSEYRKLLFIQKVANTKIKKSKLPKVSDILQIKRDRIKSDILDILNNDGIEEKQLEFAKEILGENDPLKVIASILKLSFSEELDDDNYKDIDVAESKFDRSGKVRLFVALGKKDNMTLRSLVDYITENTNVSSRKIRGVKVFENFSFITVPFEEAEIILETFKRKKGGRRSLIERAKEKK